jgi:hypothetical protein
MNIIAAAELRFESTTVVQLRPTKMTGPKIRIGGPVGTGPHTTVANNGQKEKGRRPPSALPSQRDLVDSTRSAITHGERGDSVQRRGKLGGYKNTLCMCTLLARCCRVCVRPFLQ